MSTSLSETDDVLCDNLNKYQHGISDINFWDEAVIVLSKFFEERGFNEISIGRNRKVLLSSRRNIVIKIPVNMNGNEDNYFEHHNQGNKTWIGNMARNKLIMLNKAGIAIIIMEKIDTTIPYNDLPEWATYYDCGQVGKDRRGKFKAYDYGIF